MPDEIMNIRTLTVELLRAGERHNQLLSPLTQYLGVYGNAAAGTVVLRYEHRAFESRLDELSYAVTADDDPGRRQRVLDTMGQEIAEILTSVKGVAGALTPETERPDTLTQLRIVFSASELAMLPWELAKVPAGAGAPGVWLALQARAPVCITRHIRSVSAEGMRWPTDPRVLFVAGPDTPVVEHRDALVRTLEPWSDPARPASDRLVCLERATLADIERQVGAAANEGKPFTHVHVLAHGAAVDAADRYSPIGVELYDEVVAGQLLATALTAVSEAGTCRPAVVTLATCNSGAQRSVLTPDASVAHDLHDQGIPLVVASQFPLSVKGSIPFVTLFYQGQLKGDHPLVSLYKVRLHLHSVMGQNTHDWASLVVYEAFPSDLPEQLENVRYWQSRRAQEYILKRIEAVAGVGEPFDPGHTLAARPQSGDISWARERYEELKKQTADAAAQLPTTGPYTLECAGLRAAGLKRMAQAAFRLAVYPDAPDDWRDNLFADCLQFLREAREEYWRAVKRYFASTAEPARRKANLHWLLGQVLSLDVVLGRPLSASSWEVANFAARMDTGSSENVERGWAYVSMAELALLRLSDQTLSAGERFRLAEDTVANAERMLDLLGRDTEHAATMRRQFERYADWWGNPALNWALDALGLPSRQHWQQEHGLVPTARRVVDSLPAPPAPVRPRFVRAGPPPVTSPPTSVRATSPSTSRSDNRDDEAAPTGTREAQSSPGLLSHSGGPSAIFDVEMLPAENGDCLWIEYGDRQRPRRILIDCGAASTAGLLAARAAAELSFELFVLTHIDSDHINGVLPLFADRSSKLRFADIWFNGWRQVNQFLSVKQGEDFSRLLEDPARGLPWNRAISAPGASVPEPVVARNGRPLPSFDFPDGMRLTVLSPGTSQLERLGREWHKALEELKPREAMLGRKAPPPVPDFDRFDVEELARAKEKPDTSVPNGSSIAVLAEFDGRSLLLSGDAYPAVLLSSIRTLQQERGRAGERLKLDAFKLSHHGSANATSAALLDAIDCRRYLVSTNGNIFYHPDREAIARVITRGGPEPLLVFNYRSPYNQLWEEPRLQARYGYRTTYPDAGTEGQRVQL